MGKLLTCVFGFLLLGAQILVGRACAQALRPDVQKRDDNMDVMEKFMKAFNEPLRVRESKPVTVKDAKFSVVAQTDWKPGKPWNDYTARIKCIVAPVEIQLRITNLSKSDVLFPTFNTFGLRILNADGKEVKPRGGRVGMTLTRPVLIPGGASYSLCRRAELHWDEKAKASNLVYYDGTGSQLVIGPLEPGRYKLAFWYAVARGEQTKLKGGQAETWAGEVVTDEVLVEVLETSTRGLPLEAERPLTAAIEVLVIRESKPATMKDAKLVVIAESAWKPGKRNVPIEIQLRITNLSQNDIIFPTFDTFGLIIKSEDGEQIRAMGGRDITFFTRPMLVPKGESYSLCRKAELRWNGDAKASELHYWNGTGFHDVFGPLRPGRYKLSFVYGVSPNPPLKALLRPERKRGEPPTWLGEVVTDEVVIEVLDR